MSLLNELPQWGLSNAFSFIFGLVANAIVKYISNHCKESRIKRIIKTNFKDKIFTIDNANPYYKSRNTQLNVTNDKFYLSIPDEFYYKIKQIFDDFGTEPDVIFDYECIDELGKNLQINDFSEIIERHKKIIAKEFLDKARKGIMIFNNKKLGIKSIAISRTGRDEENKLVIELYETDYYTHRVMRSVYREMGKRYKVKYIDQLNKLYCFMTSFGINSVVRIMEKGNRYIMLVKRSKYMANMEREQWHVTMNEGLNLNDVTGNTIDLNSWARRGFTEELGITDDISRNLFCTLFLNTENFEVGITSIADAVMSRESCINALKISKDGLVENVSVNFVIDNYNSVMKFIRKHEDITDTCRYSLLNYVNRMKVFNDDI